MYNPGDAAYIQSDAIKRGAWLLKPEEQFMVEWLAEYTGIRPLNFYFETVETTKGYRQQHIFIVVERESECPAMLASADKQIIIKKFQEYFDCYGPSKTDKLKSRIFPRREGVYPETIVACRPLEEIELKIAYQRADEAIKLIKPRYQDIWAISVNMIWYDVFYYTDEQVKVNGENGISESIRDEVLKAIKQYDRYGYFGPHSLRVNFNSKESFERDYSGNWYYYYK